MVSIGYLAGFVDGEGYLGLARIPRRGRSPEFCLRVSIYNTDRDVLDEIQRTTGGIMSEVGQRMPAWKPSFALIWTNAAAAKLIQQMAPFLRVKARQAVALLKFQEHIRASRRIRDSGGRLLPLPLQELVIREAF